MVPEMVWSHVKRVAREKNTEQNLDKIMEIVKAELENYDAALLAKQWKHVKE